MTSSSDSPQKKPWNATSSDPPPTNLNPSRPLPFSDEAEKSVLSSILQRPEESIAELNNRLAPDDFYMPSNRTLFKILSDMHDQHVPFEPAALLQRLIDTNSLETIGGAGSISSLYTFLSNPTNISYYAGIVEEKATIRRLITACAEGINLAYTESDGPNKLLDMVEERVGSVRREGTRNGMRNLRDMATTVIDELDRASQDPNHGRGLPVGFETLDNMTNGLQGGDMFVIAARPSMGKTSLVMNMVEYVALDLGKPALFFSLEMSARIIVQRLISSRCEINLSTMKRASLNEGQTKTLFKVVEEMSKCNLFIDETAGISITEMRRKARAIKKQYPDLALIAIDYLQLMTSHTKRAQENRQIEIAEISAGIKGIAKELDLPVIVLAQLNRQVEQRKTARPVLSDLRESGSIEQDADIVGLLTRSNYAGGKGREDEAEPRRGKTPAKPTSPATDSDDSLLIIAKHRNGPTGDVGLTFIGECTRFIPRKLNPNESD